MSPSNSPLPRKFLARRQRAGFSLVEVVLAVGVISFAFVAIMGLLPAGLQQFRQAMDYSVSSQIAQRIIQDAQLSDFATLTDSANHPSGSTATFSAFTYDAKKVSKLYVRYFDEQGNEVIPQGSTPTSDELKNVIYFVNTRITNQTNLPGNAGNTGSNPALATILVQVAYNPSGLEIKLDGSSMFALIGPHKGMPVKNYSAQVGRND